MKTSKAGVDLVKRYEGLRLEAYQDSVGVWTVGYGHTKGVREGDTCTPEQAEAWLVEDLEEAEDAVNRFILDDSAGLDQNEFDALVSFTFNLGPGWMRKSGLKEALEAHQWALVPRELTRWVYAGGQPLKGLARRRVAEAELFVS